MVVLSRLPSVLKRAAALVQKNFSKIFFVPWINLLPIVVQIFGVSVPVIIGDLTPDTDL